jgi:hypothetical protein
MFSDFKKPVLSKEYSGVSNDEPIYSLQSYYTKDHIYILRAIQSLNSLSNQESPNNAQVLCLDWDGNIEAVYKIDIGIMPNTFCVDEHNRKMYFNTPVDDLLNKNLVTQITVYNF